MRVRRTMHEQSENFNKDRKYKKVSNENTELKNRISELKKFNRGVQNGL